MKKQLTFSALLVLMNVSTVWAQQEKDTILRTNTIEVIQSYKPEVKQAPKPEFQPSMPPQDTSRPRLKYEVPDQTLYFTYHSLPLKPLALGRDTTSLPYQNYIKLGGGNLSTIYVDAGIGGLKGENFNSAIHLHHISQTGEYKDQNTALSGLEAQGALNTNTHTWYAGIDVARNQYSFYGYDHDAIKTITKDSIKQVFTGVHLNVGVTNRTDSETELSYHPAFRFHVYGDKYNNSEKTFALDVPFSQQIDEHFSYQVGLRAEYATISNKKYEDDIYNLQLRPGLRYRKDFFDGTLILIPALAQDINNKSQGYLLPDLTLTFKTKKQFAFEAGWKENLVMNTYESLTTRNPWLIGNNMFSETQTHRKEIYGAIRSNLGNHVSFTGKFSWLEWNDLPLFMNNVPDTKYFYLLNDPKVNAIAIQADLRYQVANTFAVGIGGIWTNYTKNSFARVWHEPGVQLKVDLSFKPVQDLTITAYTLVNDQIYAQDTAGKEVKLKGIFDAGLGAEYNFISRLSAFVQVNNLFNNKYERYYGYRSYGFNIFGGLRLKF